MENSGHPTARQTRSPARCDAPRHGWGSLWALVLAACGGGGGGGGPTTSKEPPPSSFTTLSGRAIDGPVEGGRVYVDINGDGYIDDTELQTGFVGTTDGTGHYSGRVNSAYAGGMIKIDLSGAIDHGNRLDDPADNIIFDEGAYWRAPPGSTILSPLTEIMVRIFGVHATAADRRSFSELLSLPADIDVTQYDAFANRADPAGQRLLALGRHAANILHEWGDAPLNQGLTGTAYVDEIIRRHDGEPAPPEQPPPDRDASPPAPAVQPPPDVDDPPTGWRVEANSAIGLENRFQQASMANPPAQENPEGQLVLIPSLGTLDLRDLPHGRVKVMDLIVDDPDTNPAFRQWLFQLHGLASRHFEIDGNAVYLTLAFLAEITSPGNPNAQKGAYPGFVKRLYIELVGRDEAFLFGLAISKNKSSVGELQITNTPLPSGQTGARLAADTSRISDEDIPEGHNLRFTYRWEKLAWHHPGDTPLPVGRSDQPHLDVTENGVFRLTVIAHDEAQQQAGHSFRTEFATVVKIDIAALRPHPVASPAGAVAASVHENFPLTLPVYEFTGDGSWQLAAGGRDNALFRIDAATGKLWFVGQDAYPVLNYENPQDAGGDNIYDIRVRRTAPDGQSETVDLALSVSNILYEPHKSNAAGWTYNFTYAQVRPLIETQAGWTDEQKTYAGWLLDGQALAMPREGPLIITWAVDPQDHHIEQESIWIDEYVTPHDETKIQNFREQVKIALTYIEGLVNIDFVEVAFQPNEPTNSRAMIEFEFHPAVIGNDPSRTYAIWESHFGEIHIAEELLNGSVLLHEIGHLLGLKHPFEQKGDFPRRLLDPSTGSWSRTNFDSQMGYDLLDYDQHPDTAKFTENDIKVLQFLYGTPGTDYDGLQSLLGLDILPPEIIDWL